MNCWVNELADGEPNGLERGWEVKSQITKFAKKPLRNFFLLLYSNFFLGGKRDWGRCKTRNIPSVFCQICRLQVSTADFSRDCAQKSASSEKFDRIRIDIKMDDLKLFNQPSIERNGVFNVYILLYK